MVDPEVSPEQTCMLGRFPVVALGLSTTEGNLSIEVRLLAHIRRISSVSKFVGTIVS